MRNCWLWWSHVGSYHLVLHLILSICLGNVLFVSVKHLWLYSLLLLECILLIEIRRFISSHILYYLLPLITIYVALSILALSLLNVSICVWEEVIKMLRDMTSLWSCTAATVCILGCLIEERVLTSVARSCRRTESLC